MMLRIEKLSSVEAVGAVEREWDALTAGLSPYVPFRSSLWNRLWWSHFRRESALVRDELFVHVVRDQQDRLLAVAPLMLTKRGLAAVSCIRMLQFFGADPFMTELRGPVCRPEDQHAVVDALSARLGRSHEFDWIEWSGIQRDAAATPDRIGLMRQHELPNYFLQLPDTWEALKTSLPRNIKESLRKCYNSLKRDGHTFEFRAVSEPDAVDAALDRFFRLHAARAGAAEMHAHRDVFDEPRARAFLRAFAAEMAARGQLRIFQIEIAGAVVATRIGFLSGSELYLYYTGYDTAWAEYSVMTTVTAEAIRWAIEQKLSIVNLSFGRDVSKTRWRPTEVSFVQGVQLSEAWRARLAFRAYEEAVRRLRPRPVAAPPAAITSEATA